MSIGDGLFWLGGFWFLGTLLNFIHFLFMSQKKLDARFENFRDHVEKVLRENGVEI